MFAAPQGDGEKSFVTPELCTVSCDSGQNAVTKKPATKRRGRAHPHPQDTKKPADAGASTGFGAFREGLDGGSRHAHAPSRWVAGRNLAGGPWNRAPRARARDLRRRCVVVLDHLVDDLRRGVGDVLGPPGVLIGESSHLRGRPFLTAFTAAFGTASTASHFPPRHRDTGILVSRSTPRSASRP